MDTDFALPLWATEKTPTEQRWLALIRLVPQ